MSLSLAALTDIEFLAAALTAVLLGIGLVVARAQHARVARSIVEIERRAAKDRERAALAEKELEAERVRIVPITEGHQHLLSTLARGFQDVGSARDRAQLLAAVAATIERVFDPSQLMVFAASDRSGHEFELVAAGGQRGSPWSVGARINDSMGRIGLAARRRVAMDRNQFDVEPPIVREQLDATEPADFVVEVVVPVVVGGAVAALVSVGGSTLTIDATRTGVELLAAHAAAQFRGLETGSRLDRLRNTDDMTGLGSKSWFVAEGSEALFRCRSEGAPAALIVLAVDDFAGYVARTGHGAGDRLLRGVADVLRPMCEDAALLARWSGSEFIVLAPRMALRSGRALAERLRSAVGAVQWVNASGQPHGGLTMSAGVGTLPGAGKNLDELIESAAEALAAARWTGNATCLAGGDAVMDDDSPTREAVSESHGSDLGRSR